MADGFLAIDQVTPADGPAWAARAADGVSVLEEGIALRRRGRLTAARWNEVLGVARLDERVYLLVPRRPPEPPWIEVDGGGLDGGAEGLTRAIRARLSAHGYRDASLARPLLPPDELLARLRARRVVPGAVEVPVGRGPPVGRMSWTGRVLVGTAAAVATGSGGAFVALGAGLADLAAIAAAASCAVLGAAGSVGLASLRPARGRVLALAPDGCVVGFPEGVRAFGWSELGPFSAIRLETPGLPDLRPALHVTARDGSGLGAIDAAWFTRPLDLIVEVAEAYRSRWGRDLATE